LVSIPLAHGSLFSRVAFADEDTNPWKFNASVGIGGRGLLPQRDDDVFGAGYYYSDLDPDRFTVIEPDDSEQGVEVFYNLAITPATRLSFDFQWLDTPIPGLDDAYLFAARLQTSF